jgi:hypothetical protein
VNSKNRRFCAECIKERICYLLIWQVREIKLCDKHHVYLQDACPSCKAPIPYIHDMLSFGKCPKCNIPLSKASTLCCTSTEIEYQVSLYRQWEYLMKTSFVQSQYNQSLSKGRYLAAKLLYIAQNQEPKLDRGHMSIPPDYVCRLIFYIKGTEDKKRYTVTMPLIQNLLRGKNIDTKMFYNLQVPNSYLNSIFQEGNETLTIGGCLSPWCSSYNNSEEMLPLHFSLGYLYNNYEKFTYPHICRSCSLRYGFNHDGEWREVDQFIYRAYFQGVIPLLNAGAGIGKIAEVLNSDRFMVNKLIAYFTRHGLLNEEATIKYAPKTLIKETIEYFRLLSNLKGSKVAVARNQFDWGIREYYYHFFHPDVQLFLHETYFLERKVIKTSFVEKATQLRKLQHSRIELIEREELWKQAQAFVDEKVKNHEHITDEAIYDFIRKGQKWINTNMPELKYWFLQKKRELQNHSDQAKKSDRLNRSIVAICELFKLGLPISHEQVAEKSGVGRKYMRMHGLVVIVNKIREALWDSKLTVKQLEAKLQDSLNVEQWKKFIIELK